MDIVYVEGAEPFNVDVPCEHGQLVNFLLAFLPVECGPPSVSQLGYLMPQNTCMHDPTECVHTTHARTTLSRLRTHSGSVKDVKRFTIVLPSANGGALEALYSGH